MESATNPSFHTAEEPSMDLEERVGKLEAVARELDTQQWRAIGEVAAIMAAVGVIAGEPDLSLRPKLFVQRLERARANLLNQPIAERSLDAIERGLKSAGEALERQFDLALYPPEARRE
jgi:hypothetical protein